MQEPLLSFIATDENSFATHRWHLRKDTTATKYTITLNLRHNFIIPRIFQIQISTFKTLDFKTMQGTQT